MYAQVPRVVALAFLVVCVEPDLQPVLHFPKQQRPIMTFFPVVKSPMVPLGGDEFGQAGDEHVFDANSSGFFSSTRFGLSGLFLAAAGPQEPSSKFLEPHLVSK